MVVFDADINQVNVPCTYCKNIMYLVSMDNCSVKASKSYKKYFEFA